ncbi:MAG TPA: glycosyltransferase [Flavobacteriales bacterium]|nr:glycosyltransferase [Flavobacteriales bacterium]
MKRVLIISYYWPPNGGAGVYRWLKMSKYLPEFGWQPVVYTPENPEMVADDPGLLKDVGAQVEVVKQPITEPFSLYKRFTGRAQSERVQTAFLSEKRAGGWKEDLALWVRSNFFIPDARVWWVKPSIRFLKDYVKEHQVDAIISTGPPHSMHLIAQGLKRATGLPWIADFRDPWTGIDFYGQLSLTNWADRKHHRLEREVLTTADRVVTVSWSWANDLEALGAKTVAVITNGFDRADVPEENIAVDDRFSLVHIGSMSATRDLPGLWKALAAIGEKDLTFRERFVLRFVGPVDHSVVESATAAGLGGHIERMGRVSHAVAMQEMQRARVLLLPINDTPNSAGILPGKLYEYMSVGRPILAVGPGTGDVARVLGSGHTLLSREPDLADQAHIRSLFDRSEPVTGQNILRYDRRELAKAMAELLNEQRATAKP